MNRLLVLPCPADGSCFFHCVLLASSAEYREDRVGHQRLPKAKIARQFRDDLAQLLELPANGHPDGPTWYSYLSRGQLPIIAQTMPEFSLQALQHKLRSGKAVGTEFHELVSDVANKDIYIVDGSKGSLYNIGDDELLYLHRPSIILLHRSGHYDLMAKDNGTGQFQMVFDPDDEIIRELRSPSQSF